MLQQMVLQQNEMMRRLEVNEQQMNQLRNENMGLVAANTQLQQQQQMTVVAQLPDVLKKLGEQMEKGGKKSESLIDSKGLGKPFGLTDHNVDGSFRIWAIKTCDFVISVLGEKSEKQ